MKKVIWFSALHGINDCIAGFLLGSLLYQGLDNIKIAFYVVFYNILSFLGQPLVAFFLRIVKRPDCFVIACQIFLLLGISIFTYGKFISILCIGISSAIVHVVGGMESFNQRQKASDIGLFASPGIVGLAIGGVLAYGKIDALFILFIFVSFLGLIYFFLRDKKENKQEYVSKSQSIDFDDHDLIMLLLLGVISLRSIIWNVFQSIHNKEYWILLYFAIAAMLGKLVGGILSDRFGAKRYAYSSILVSIPFITFWKENYYSSLIGVFLLQSSFPATTFILLQKMKTKIDFAIAYSFGVSVILGGFLFFSPIQSFLISTRGILILFGFIFLMFYYSQEQSQKIK